MHEMHLRQSGFTYSACCLRTIHKKKKRIQKLKKKKADSRYIYMKELDKVCF